MDPMVRIAVGDVDGSSRANCNARRVIEGMQRPMTFAKTADALPVATNDDLVSVPVDDKYSPIGRHSEHVRVSNQFAAPTVQNSSPGIERNEGVLTRRQKRVVSDQNVDKTFFVDSDVRDPA